MRPEAAQIMAKLVPVLAPLQNTAIVVTGYTDNAAVGGSQQRQGIETRLQLSLRRAQTITQYFIVHGVDPKLVTTQALQDPDRVARNESAAQGPQDNRIELTLMGPGN
jgi:flagellar motor protein MotB